MRNCPVPANAISDDSYIVFGGVSCCAHHIQMWLMAAANTSEMAIQMHRKWNVANPLQLGNSLIMPPLRVLFGHRHVQQTFD